MFPVVTFFFPAKNGTVPSTSYDSVAILPTDNYSTYKHLESSVKQNKPINLTVTTILSGCVTSALKMAACDWRDHFYRYLEIFICRYPQIPVINKISQYIVNRERWRSCQQQLQTALDLENFPQTRTFPKLLEAYEIRPADFFASMTCV